MLTSVPFGAFLFLLGLFWVTKSVEPPPEDAEDPLEAEKAYRQARRRQAFIGILRLAATGLGMLLLIGNFANGLGSIEDWGSLAVLTTVYGLILLAVQRSEQNRRLATLLLSLFLWLILVPRYAIYRGWEAESNWGIYAALALNYIFWVLIGRRYPPHSSKEIYVWGMDD